MVEHGGTSESCLRTDATYLMARAEAGEPARTSGIAVVVVLGALVSVIAAVAAGVVLGIGA